MTNTLIKRMVGYWTRESVAANQDYYYIFEDNEKGVGRGGQACIRGLPNAFGIPTKGRPSMDPTAFWCDADIERQKAVIDDAIWGIPTDKPWIISTHGLGTGLSRLPELAPLTYQHLLHRITTLEYENYVLPDGWGLFLRTNKYDRCSWHEHARGFQWPESGFVRAKDWNSEECCGFGLHGVLWGQNGTVWDSKGLWCVFAAPLEDAVALSGKHKVPLGIVVYHGTQEGASNFIARYERNPNNRNYAVERSNDRYLSVVQGREGLFTHEGSSRVTQSTRSIAVQGPYSRAMQGDASSAKQAHMSVAIQGSDGMLVQGATSIAIQESGGLLEQGKNSIAVIAPNGRYKGESGSFVVGYQFDSCGLGSLVATVAMVASSDWVVPSGMVRLDPGVTYRCSNGKFLPVEDMIDLTQEIMEAIR